MAAEMSEDVDIEASSSASDEDLERFESMSNQLYWLFASTSYDRDYIMTAYIVFGQWSHVE